MSSSSASSLSSSRHIIFYVPSIVASFLDCLHNTSLLNVAVIYHQTTEEFSMMNWRGYGRKLLWTILTLCRP